MATFEFTSPEGKKYQVDGPEGATEAQAFQVLQKQLTGAEPASVDEKSKSGSSGGNVEQLLESKRSRIDELTRQLGLTVRAGVGGALSLPAMAADAVTAPINAGLGLYDKLTGAQENGYRIPRQGEALNNVMTAAGLPVPENATERVVQDVAGGMAGAGGMVKASEALAKGGTGIVRGIGEALAAGPKLQAGSAAAGAGASGITRESGGSTGAQVAAGLAGALAPGFAGTAAKGAARALLRGGEAGRAKVAENIELFKDAANTTPTLGQATEGRWQQAVESLMSKFPGSAGVMAKKAEQQLDDMAKSVKAISDELAPGASAVNAGEAITRGVNSFKEAFKDIQEKLYKQLDTHIPSSTRIKADRTQAILSDLNEDIAGAPALSKWFKNARIQGIEGALESDTGGIKSVLSRPGMQEKADSMRKQLIEESQNASAANERHMGNLLQQADESREANKLWRQQQFDEAEQAAQRNEARKAMTMGGDREPVLTAKEINALPEPYPVMSNKDIKDIKPPNVVRTEPEIQQEIDDFLKTQVDNSLPYEALKKLRTLVGREIADNSLVSDVPRSKWTALYAALSDDLGDAAVKAGPRAEKAWDRANTYTRLNMQRLEQLSGILSRDAPEKIFTSAISGTSEGDTVIKRVMKSLPEQERREVSAAVLQRMGRAKPGQQNAEGDAFSSETFLTNLSKISPTARTTLFGRAGNAELQGRVQDLAEMAENLRKGSKVFSNPSGTAQSLTLKDTAVGVGAAALSGQFGLAAGLASVPVAANLTARAVTSPGLVKFAAGRTGLNEGALPSAVNAIANASDTMQDNQAASVAAIGAAQTVDQAIEAAAAASGMNQ
ncbi:MAG: hypothetical protein V4772_08710 [Pseudomonadota bacterium]